MEWQPVEKIIFDNSIEVLHCDTRDFHCNVLYESDKKYQLTQGYIFTIDQVREILFKLKKDSGGEKDWRLLSFEKDKTDSSWSWKYIRVYKAGNGYGIGHARQEQMRFVKKQFFKHHKVNLLYSNG